MIFVTVGTQLPFDRLIKAIDEFAVTYTSEVVAQTGIGSYKPIALLCKESISREVFEKYVESSSLVVSHAGMGTVLAAMKYNKPHIIVPRLYEFGEHRNDHQLATVEFLKRYKNIHVVDNIEDLSTTIFSILNKGWEASENAVNGVLSQKIESLLMHWIPMDGNK